MGGALTRMLGLSSAIGTDSSARYWRLRFPDGSADATWLAVSEISMAGSVGGADLATSANASASSENAFDVAGEAFDGTTDRWFAASGQQANAWIANDLTTPVDVEEIFVYGDGQHPEYLPDAILVEFSHDGSTWFTDNRWPTLTSLLWGTGASFGQVRRIRRETSPRLTHIATLASLNENTSGWNNFTLRQVIAGTVNPGGGNRVKFSLRSGTTEGLAISKAYIGIKGAGTYDFASAPTQVTFNGGSTSFSVAASTTQMSDDIALTIGASDGLVISVYCASALDTFRRNGGTQAGVTAGFKAGDSAIDTTVAGYSSQNRVYLANLEVWDTAS